MEHHFNVDIAVKYGVNAAILLNNLAYWIKKNEANDTNYFDGNYWTYNSRKAYRELFPYMSERQIDTAFKKLIDDGIVITGNYNKQGWDRTLWYALTQKGKCILHFDGMETYEMSNGNDQNVKAIPNINTDKKSNKKSDKESKKAPSGYDAIIAEYTSNEELRQALYEFIKMRKMIKKQLTDRALSLCCSKLDKLASSDIDKIAIVNQSVEHCWQSFYELKTDSRQEKKQDDQSKWCHSKENDDMDFDFWGK